MNLSCNLESKRTQTYFATNSCEKERYIFSGHPIFSVIEKKPTILKLNVLTLTQKIQRFFLRINENRWKN